MNQHNPIATGVALGITLVLVFIVCAIVQAIAPGVQASHMWINLFTAAEIGSASAWMQGLLSSAIAGFLGGVLFAFVYNKVSEVGK
jgi:Na+-transporting NADH:ubiquinone oxidoreductase subunit NqrE